MKLILTVLAVSALAGPALAEPTLQCLVTSADSGVARSPTVVVTVPTSKVAEGYQVTGGGCDLSGPEPGAPGGRPHNGPITASKPVQNGWYCRAMDPPGIPENYSVMAHVVYCRVTHK